MPHGQMTQVAYYPPYVSWLITVFMYIMGMKAWMCFYRHIAMV